jgi:hypothetical protein
MAPDQVTGSRCADQIEARSILARRRRKSGSHQEHGARSVVHHKTRSRAEAPWAGMLTTTVACQHQHVHTCRGRDHLALYPAVSHQARGLTSKEVLRATEELIGALVRTCVQRPGSGCTRAGEQPLECGAGDGLGFR